MSRRWQINRPFRYLGPPVLALLVSIVLPQVANAQQKGEDASFAGVGFRLGGLVPRQADYGGTSAGGVLDLFYWFERPHFAIEPRVGFHFDVDQGEEASFFECPIDVGAFILLTTSRVTPFFGGGGGIRYLRESRTIRVRTGTLLVTEAVNSHEDSAWGASLYARAGLLFARNHSFRFALNVDYNVTFVELNAHDNPESLTVGLSIIF